MNLPLLLGNRLPGVLGVLRGMGFMVGEVTAAELAAIPCEAAREGEERHVPGSSGVASRKVRCRYSGSAWAWADVAALPDPGADRILFWDDSAGSGGEIAALSVGTGLAISGTTLSNTATASPGGSDTHVQFNDGGAFAGDAGLTYNKSSDVLSVSGGLQVAAHNTITDVLVGSATWDPPSVNAGEGATTTLTITGAAVGDYVVCSLSTLTTQLMQLTGTVEGAGTVRATLGNTSAGAINLGSGTLRCLVIKAS